jgi:hypothetical protein
MGLLRALFGPSKDEIWRQLCSQTGGTFVEGGFFKGSKVLLQHGEWTLTLDTYTVSSGNNSQTTYTRLRAPYTNANEFQFEVYREGLFSGLGRTFGMQDVEVGHPEFDRDFVIKGNCEIQLRALFDNASIREFMHCQPRIRFEVRDDEGWFGTQFPAGVDELRFTCVGVIKEVDQLKDLYDLFAETLEQLCEMGSAYEDNPNVDLK